MSLLLAYLKVKKSRGFEIVLDTRENFKVLNTSSKNVPQPRSLPYPISAQEIKSSYLSKGIL